MKAKFLYEQVQKIPRMMNETDHEIACDTRAGHNPAFTGAQLLIVMRLFKQFYNSYVRAMVIGPYNCIGNQFLDDTWAYASLCCHDVTESRFLFCINK